MQYKQANLILGFSLLTCDRIIPMTFSIELISSTYSMIFPIDINAMYWYFQCSFEWLSSSITVDDVSSRQLAGPTARISRSRRERASSSFSSGMKLSSEIDVLLGVSQSSSMVSSICIPYLKSALIRADSFSLSFEMTSGYLSMIDRSTSNETFLIASSSRSFFS